MATIQTLPSGKVRVLIRRRSLPALSRTFTKRSVAEDWAKQIEAEIINGDFQARLEAARIDALVPTLKDALEKYVETESIKKRGYRQESQRAKEIGERDIGKLKLTQITPGTLVEYRDKRMETVAPNTVRLELALISVLFTHHLERETPGLTENPCLKVKKPKPPHGRNRKMGSAEEERLLSAAGKQANPELHAIIMMGIHTAMRLNEILGLEWRHVHFNDGIAHLPKTKNSEPRDVPLTDAVLDILQQLKKSRQDKKDERVFHYTNDGFRTMWYRVLHDAGIDHKGLHFHDLRHIATTRLFSENDLNVMEAAAITGHKDLRMLKRYTHLDARDIRKKLKTGNDKPAATPEPAGSMQDRLRTLKGLLDEELISKTEFEAKKVELLKQL